MKMMYLLIVVVLYKLYKRYVNECVNNVRVSLSHVCVCVCVCVCLLVLRRPQGEVVAEELHDERCVFVSLWKRG